MGKGELAGTLPAGHNTNAGPSARLRLISRAMRPPVDTIAGAAVPRGTPWVNVAPLRMDKQRGRPVLVEFWDFCRVNSLRTLPYVTAWHERYAASRAARDLRAHARASRRRARRGRGARRGRAARHRAPRLPRPELRALARSTTTRAGRRATCWSPDAAARRLPLRRGRLRRDRARRSRSCSASSASRCAPLRPEDDPEALIVVPTADAAGAYAGPTRRAACGRCSSGAGRVVANGRDDRGRRTPAPTRSSSTPGTPRACSTSRSATASTCHATCFTPGVAPELGPRSASRAGGAARGGPVAVELDRAARPVRARCRLRPTKPRLVDPASRCCAAARRRRRHSTGSSPGSGPARWVWPKTTWSARRRRAGATTSRHREQARARSAGPREVGAQRPEPGAVERARSPSGNAGQRAPAPAAAARPSPAQRAPCAAERRRRRRAGRRARAPRRASSQRVERREDGLVVVGARVVRRARRPAAPSAPAPRRSKLGTVTWRSR